MNDDFDAPEPYKKGKGKVIELKAWQSRQGGEVKVDKFRCWDGLHGCEQYKGHDQFKWHPRVCGPCTAMLSTRYGTKQSDVTILTMLLFQEQGLYLTVKEMGAKPEKIAKLQKNQDYRIGQLMSTLLQVWSKENNPKVMAAGKAYRDWFFAEADVEVKKAPRTAQGMVSVAGHV